MKRIIHVTDYSKNAVAALKYAYMLSSRLSANLVVIHVFDIPTIMTTELKEPYYHLEKDTFKMHHTKLEEFCRKHLGQDLNKMGVSVEAVEDKSVVNGIVLKINELNASLVVTGMKGESKFKEFIMGNTTKHLIEKSPCPVLSIPSGASHPQIKTIVYATDFEEVDLDTVKKLTEIAKVFNAEIKIVHIATNKEYDGKTQMAWFKELLENKISYKKITCEVLPSGDIYNSLRVYLVDVEADLIVFLEREHKGILDDILHRDLVKRMESYGQIPLLSFNKINYELLNF